MRVHIVTNSQTQAYHDYCIQNHRALADKPDELEFYSYCLDGGSYLRISHEGGKAIRIADSSGSVGHALGIQSILMHLQPNEPNVISDGDCIVLMKGWDSRTRELLSENGIIGTTYEDIGGFSSGNGSAQTYKKIPNFTWAALSPNYSWEFDAMCQKQENLIIDESNSDTFNLPSGSTLLREGNWKLPIYLKENSIPYYSLVFVRPTSSDAKAVLSGEDYHTEYQTKEGEPFVAHQRGSMSKAFRNHHLSRTFYDACEEYLRKIQQ